MITNPLPVQNLATLPGTNDIRGIKPPVEIPNHWLWALWIAGVLLLIAAAWLAWRYRRQQAAQALIVPLIPPHVRARNLLQQALALIDQPQPFCIAVSDTVRRYLEERFNFHAPERTTEEFLHELKATDLLMPDQKQSLGEFLNVCDMVKFARYEPGRPELEALHASALRLVDETEPQPAPPPATPGSSRHGMNFSFAHPWMLSLLLVLPVLAWLKGRRRSQPAFLYSSVQLVKGIIGITRSSAGSILPKLRWLALAFFICALAQPRFIHSEAKVKASGVDIVVALDLSGSMAAEDEGFLLNGQQANRFTIAREVLKKFVAKRPSDRLGLVVFATQAFVAVPPTLDHDFLLQNLGRLELGSINGDQTAIGSALVTSMNRLRDLKSKSKIVVLMTDGQNNAGKVPPLTAAEAAEALGIKVYTIGVSTRGVARMPGRNPFTGQKTYSPMPVDVDEKTLTAIADKTHGKYYRADSTDSLAKIYADIDRLEKTEADIKKYTYFSELFPWAILPGMFLLLLETILSHTVWRKLP